MLVVKGVMAWPFRAAATPPTTHTTAWVPELQPERIHNTKASTDAEINRCCNRVTDTLNQTRSLHPRAEQPAGSK